MIDDAIAFTAAWPAVRSSPACAGGVAAPRGRSESEIRTTCGDNAEGDDPACQR